MLPGTHPCNWDSEMMMMVSSLIPHLPPNVAFAVSSMKSSITVSHPGTNHCMLHNFVKKPTTVHMSP